MSTNISYLKINKVLIYIVFFFIFIGYYASLLLASNVVGLELSRLFTIPIRVLILVCLLLLGAVNFRHLKKVSANALFYLFVFIYCIRLAIDYNSEAYYYMSVEEVFMYLVSFCILPYLIISKFSFNEILIKVIFKSMLHGGFLFSVLVLVYYGKFIGQVSRLGAGVAHEDVLNPLALSYSSALIIGVFSFYILHNSLKRTDRIIAIVTIILSIIPFFLGASRGSLIALGITIVVYLFCSKNIKTIFRSLMFMILSVILLVFLDGYLNSGLIDRMTQTSQDIDQGNSSAQRLTIWNNALDQFYNNPFIGDKLEVNNWESYAHNLFVETLQTTGILGFIPLLILVVLTWKNVFRIAIHYKQYFWIAVIFIQSFIQSMFSGAIYISSWIWVSMALIWGIINYINSKLSSKI